MDPLIRDRFNDDILQDALRRFAIDPQRIRPLDSFESYIYEFSRDDGDYILRIGHDSRRPANLVRGEMDFINAVAAGGASVARSMPAVSGDYVEEIADGQGGRFVIAAFIKAPGGHPWAHMWTPEGYERYGRLLGRIHAVSKQYQPAQPAWRRPEWDDPLMDDALANMPPSETVAADRYRAVRAAIAELPRDSGAYGLIHFDAHEGNLFLDEDGRITLFDFDDCSYNWYACDIAMVVFYKVSMFDDPEAHAAEFLPAFMRGYRAETEIDRASLAHIPLFLKQREIDLYAAILHELDADKLEGWAARYMDGRKERIESGVPYLAVDFNQLVT